MTSMRQAEANRLNPQKSTGPTTEAGKEQSRRNSLSHGLSAKKLRIEEVEEIVVERFEMFSASLPAETDVDLWYLQQVAVESVRIEQAQALEQTMRVELAQRAATCWHEDRASEASDLFEKIAKRPERVARSLEKTRHGCERLIAQWELMACIPISGQTWNADQRDMVLDLLGVSHQARLIKDRVPQTAPEQSALAASEIARLQRRRIDALDALDASAQKAAIQGTVKPDRDIKLVRRYEAMSRRVFDMAMQHLKSRNAKSKGTETVARSAPEAVDRRTADIGSLEVLVNELKAMEARAEILAPLPATEKSFETVSATTTPPRPPGNRKARRAAEHAKRKRGR
jgi:hypothetical protein